MPIGKGGKNRRRGKNENEETKRELEFKEAGQEYAQVGYNVWAAYFSLCFSAVFVYYVLMSISPLGTN